MAGISAPLPRSATPKFALRALGDDRLVRLAAAGDERAFEAIYERYHQALYRYCRSIVGNSEDAADALQSTMASALRGLSGEERTITLKPWLFRIAHNESISLLRKRRAHAPIDDDFELEAPEDDPAMRQRLRELVADLKQLPEAQRGALVMHELSGLRYREIGEALGTTDKHARQIVFEARTALHDMAEGRAMECESVQRAISDNDGRVLRGRRIRSHLRGCSDCAGFAELMGTRKRDLAMIAPPIPAGLAAGLLHHILGGGGGTLGGGGGGIAAAATGKAVATPLLAKAGIVVAAAALAGAGTYEIEQSQTHHANRTHQSAPAAAARHAEAVNRTINLPKAAAAVPGSSKLAPGARGKHHGATNKQTAAHTHPAHPTHPAHSQTPAGTTGPGKPAHPTHPTHPAQPTQGPKSTPPGQQRRQDVGAKPKKTPPSELKKQQQQSAPVVTVPVQVPAPPLPTGATGCTGNGHGNPVGNQHC